MAQDVSIRDVDIPFMRLVFVMVKLMFASIPALLIFGLIMSLIMMVLAGIGGGILDSIL